MRFIDYHLFLAAGPFARPPDHGFLLVSRTHFSTAPILGVVGDWGVAIPLILGWEGLGLVWGREILLYILFISYNVQKYELKIRSKVVTFHK